jgi:hypothetical protein
MLFLVGAGASESIVFLRFKFSLYPQLLAEKQQQSM